MHRPGPIQPSRDMTGNQIEQRTREIGREIFARAGAVKPRLADWLDQQMMSLTMRDEGVKVQLFRFTDALPALKSDLAVNGHLREYFEEVRERLPQWAQTLGQYIPEDGYLGGLVAWAARCGAHRLARRFIAGSNVQEMIRTVERLRNERMTFTADLLGEAVLTEEEAKSYQGQYLSFIAGLADRSRAWPQMPQIDSAGGKPMARVNVSVKLSSLFSQFDPIDPKGTAKAVRERLWPILREARSRGVFVNIDMEQHAFKDLTLQICEEVFGEGELRDWEDVGIAIQAYLRSCRDDLERLRAFAQRRGTPVWVRLVKGAYWDFETVVAAQQNWPVPVFTDKAATDANFEEMTDFLIENRSLLRPAIASHNVRSIAHAMARRESVGADQSEIEFQMLYGMADELKSVLVDAGERMRVYTPFGELLPGMAYLVRRLLENTSNQSFLRAGFMEHVPVEKLLMNPIQIVSQRESARPRSSASSDDRGFRNEPLADFSREENRRAMERALQEVTGRLGSTYPMIIDGQKIASAKTIDSVDPSQFQRVVGRCAAGSAENAISAVEAANRAYSGWRNLSAQNRADYLFQCARILRRRRWELSAWEVYECGKQWRESDADVAEAIDYCEYYAREILRLSRPDNRNTPGETNEFFYEPRGVAVVIAPWNFPLAILTGMTTAALAAGNTVVMKPAEQSCVIGAKLMEVFEEAALPAGVVNLVSGIGEEVGPALVDHPLVSVIAFTGSRAVGLGINASAAIARDSQDHVKRVIVEMGGKNAIIVDEDADLDEALHGVAASAFGYSGQKCSACSRVIVVGGIYETFLKRLVEVTRSLKVAPAEDPASFVGPVIDQDAFDRIRGVIGRAKQEFQTAYAGETGELEKQGYFIGPHIFGDVPPQSWLAQEEVFGPVLCALRAADLTEALQIANGTRYALTGGIYSRSPANIARTRREFRVGNLYINRKITGALVDRQPFGGFKLSGGGTKAGGSDYLLQFLIQRVVTENTLRRGFAPAEEGAGE